MNSQTTEHDTTNDLRAALLRLQKIGTHEAEESVKFHEKLKLHLDRVVKNEENVNQAVFAAVNPDEKVAVAIMALEMALNEIFRAASAEARKTNPNAAYIHGCCDGIDAIYNQREAVRRVKF